MTTVQGYFNGIVCIPLENVEIKENQKVLITILDEFTVSTTNIHSRQLDFMKGQFSIPPNFDTMYESEILSQFEGTN